ncbi:MAG: ABC transporter ATP-binding protein [Oscillospiraceae bacterium]|jgi:branched-chain amino acid transport system ATP-binding protein|nr:ABC transporter ATP-binding protein [Oscillospiraceae bacterium]
MMMLSVSGLSVAYGAIQAIHDVSFHVEKGEIVTLIGANGAGKSTILKTVSGLLRPKAGTIQFEDKQVHSLDPHRIVRMGLAQVPEGRRIFQRMTVLENLEMGAFARGGRADLSSGYESVFHSFPRLKERRGQLAGTLSGGEQQMLAMGRALMGRPRLLMLDEPSMGLSPILVEEIFRIIRQMNADGITILLVEQNAQMALSVADRAYVLETGRVVKEGGAASFMGDEAVRKAYLGL